MAPKKTVSQGDGCILISTVERIDIPEDSRSRLDALAAANGHSSIEKYVAWLMNECDRDTEEIREDIAGWITATHLDIAHEILWDASHGEFYPWGMDPWPDGVDDDAFRKKIEEWAVPHDDEESVITPEHAGWMKELGLAALAHDGRRAYELGMRIYRAWYDTADDDDGPLRASDT